MTKKTNAAKKRIDSLQKFERKNRDLISFLLSSNVLAFHSVEIDKLKKLNKTAGGAIDLQSPYREAADILAEVQREWLLFSEVFTPWKEKTMRKRIGGEEFVTTLKTLEASIAKLRHVRKSGKETLARHYMERLESIRLQTASEDAGRFLGKLSTCLSSKIKDELSFEEVAKARRIVLDMINTKAA